MIDYRNGFAYEIVSVMGNRVTAKSLMLGKTNNFPLGDFSMLRNVPATEERGLKLEKAVIPYQVKPPVKRKRLVIWK